MILSSIDVEPILERLENYVKNQATYSDETEKVNSF